MADWQSVYESQFADGTLVCQQLGAQEVRGLNNRLCQRRPLRISCLHSSCANLSLAEPYFTNPPSIDCSFLAGIQGEPTPIRCPLLEALSLSNLVHNPQSCVLQLLLGNITKNWEGWKLLPAHILGSLHILPCSWQEWFPVSQYSIRSLHFEVRALLTTDSFVIVQLGVEEEDSSNPRSWDFTDSAHSAFPWSLGTSVAGNNIQEILSHNCQHICILLSQLHSKLIYSSE